MSSNAGVTSSLKAWTVFYNMLKVYVTRSLASFSRPSRRRKQYFIASGLKCLDSKLLGYTLDTQHIFESCWRLPRAVSPPVLAPVTGISIQPQKGLNSEFGDLGSVAISRHKESYRVIALLFSTSYILTDSLMSRLPTCHVRTCDFEAPDCFSKAYRCSANLWRFDITSFSIWSLAQYETHPIPVD